MIGAGDGRYLAWGGTVVLAVFAPAGVGRGEVTPPTGAPTLVWLWVAFGVGFMAGRAVVLVRRARGTAWMVAGG